MAILEERLRLQPESVFFSMVPIWHASAGQEPGNVRRLARVARARMLLHFLGSWAPGEVRPFLR